jgi:hypothetical protein
LPIAESYDLKDCGSAVPAHVGVSIVPVVIVSVFVVPAVFPHFTVIAPGVPMTAPVPVTVFIAIVDVANTEANADANAADMDTDSHAVSAYRSCHCEGRGGEPENSECAA